MKNRFKLFISLLIGILGLSSIFSAQLFAEDSDNTLKQDKDLPTMMNCYIIAAPKDKIPDDDDLKDSKDKLDKMHKDGKINDETYNSRKDTIDKQLDESPEDE